MNLNYLTKISKPVAVFFLASFVCANVLASQVATPYTKAMRYDLAGQLTGVILPDPDGDGPLLHPATRNTYNEYGLLVMVEVGELRVWQDENTAPGDWTSFVATQTQLYEYNDLNLKVLEAVLNAEGFTESLVQYNYEKHQRVLCKAQRLSAKDYLPSNYSGLPDACAPQASAYGPDRVSRYTYNQWNQVKTEDRAVGTELEQTYVVNTYDEGLLKTQTDANGNITELEYQQGRLYRRYYPSKTFRIGQSPSSPGDVNYNDYNEYNYDLNGNVEVEVKRNKVVVTHTHDNNNRLIKESYSSQMADVHYGYNLQGLTLYSRFGSASGQGITNSFDGFGNLTNAVTNMGGTTRALSYAYDNNGNRIRITHPDTSAYFSYKFDELNRIASVHEYDEETTPILSVLYNNRNRRDSLLRLNAATTGYEYDGAGRLQQFRQDLSGSVDDLINIFTYNPVGQVTAINYSNSQYRHPGNGNRTGVYAPNGLNQYTQVNDVPMDYDSNGNLTVDGTRTYSYDDESRLTGITDTDTADPTGATFTYDPLGRLFEVVIDGVGRQFLYDGDALVAEYTSSTATTPIRRYVHGDQVDEPLVEYQGSNLGVSSRRYLHTNHQGSIIAHTDQNGSAVAKLSYDAYGIPGDGNTGRFGYTGQIWFEELGLYHYKAPTLGRFLQTDPVGYEDQMNLYAYVGNDPLNRVDPTGMYQEIPGDKTNKVLAQMFGFKNEAQANQALSQGMESTFSRENLAATLDATSMAAGIVAVGATATGQLEVAGPAAVVSAATGIAAAALSDDPVKGVVTEVAAQVTGTKTVGTAGKIVSGMIDTKAAKNVVDAGAQAASEAVSDQVREQQEKVQH